MSEPDVTLTDFGVALEAALFVMLIWRAGSRDLELRRWFMLLFASVSAASLFGGTVHGFFPDRQAPGQATLWTATLLSMGLTALSMWAVGALLLLSPRLTRWVMIAAVAQFVVFAAVVLVGFQPFWVGIVDNLPALIFLFVALGVTARRQQTWQLWLATAGPALVVLAAAIQQLKIGVHPEYFNHNALYHVLQAIAIYLLFLGAWRLLDADRDACAVVDPVLRGADTSRRSMGN
jgi:hypothetical protein